MRIPRCWLVTATLMLACGGETAGPDPEPEVASITVDRANAQLVPGEEVTFVATAKTSAGAAIADATITWSSSAPAVATVADGRVRGLAAGTALIAAASGNAREQIAVQVDQGGFVGPAGGTITAFDGGIRLTVPPGAVTTGTAIRLTGIPAPIPDPIFVRASGGGVSFAGTFSVPATLTLTYNPANRPTGLPEARLGVGILNGGEWEHVAGSTVDAAAHAASVSITRAGNYGVIMAPSTTACAGAAHREFDFRLGAFSWSGPANLAGEAVITADAGGCALREDLRIQSGSRVRAVFFHDPASGMWHYTSIDGSAITRLSGGMDNGRMILYNAARNVRVVWSAEPDGAAHTQTGESSPNGSEWTRLGSGTYTRR